MRTRCRECAAPIHYRTLARVREALVSGVYYCSVEQKKASAAEDSGEPVEPFNEAIVETTA